MTPDGGLVVSGAETVRIWRLEQHTAEDEDAAFASFGISSVDDCSRLPSLKCRCCCSSLSLSIFSCW